MARHSVREEIIEAALEQFHAYGFNAAGVKDITDRAGVPKGSFYNHIDSKEALAVVALQRCAERRRLEDLADPSAAPLARLGSHFELLRAKTEGHGFTRGCLLGNLGAEVADHSDVLRAAVGQNLARWAELISQALAQAQHAGSLRPARSAGHPAVCSQRLGRHADLGPGPTGQAPPSTPSSTWSSAPC